MAIGDFNGDGLPDLAVGAFKNFAVVLNGAFPDLVPAIEAGTSFTLGQPGRLKVTVRNSGAFASTAPVSAMVTLPLGLTASQIYGTGWSCTLNTLTCTRADTVPAGSPFSPISVYVHVAPDASPDLTATATVSGGGEIHTANDTTTLSLHLLLPTTTSLTSAQNPSTFGQQVTLTATVSAGTGNITFYDGSAILGVAKLAGSQARFSTLLLSAGSHAVTARYDGDATYGPSISPVLPQTVQAVPASGFGSTSVPVGAYSGAISVADFNSDGVPDFVTANGGDHSISVVVGKEEAVFEQRSNTA